MVSNSANRQIRFSLNISADEYVRYYRGSAKYVRARSSDGKTVRFPANILQPYLTHDGIHGHYVMHYDENNKFLKLEKIA
jgi:hypothetical protein